MHKQANILVEAEEQLHSSEKLAALGQLSASLAHEVRNPLAAIRGAVEILADDFPPGHPKHEFSDILLKETSRLSTTVEEVLHYSKKQHAAFLHLHPETLLRALERVRVLLGNNLRSKNIILTIDLEKVNAEVCIDEDKLIQVFMNLLLNCCEAMVRSGTIEISTGQDERDIQIFIKDDGPGIPLELRDKIFTAFYSTKKEGTGLGLAISRSIIESYGGTLSFKSNAYGLGTTFIVSIPIAQKVFDENSSSY